MEQRRPDHVERPRPETGDRPRPENADRPRPENGERPRPENGERSRPAFPRRPAGAPQPGGAPGPAGDERESERGLRGLVGSGSSQVSVGAALRARDAARPSETHLADADRNLVIVRRNWVPREELPRNR
ncbi:hypothetical protein [Paractinoplanes tereljensis]|uniref:hypothetical protein n=1 Tax=Paractinoplanes tereljensis TaxID=571912 RepID=UPI003F691436